ncbi:MAG: iron-sulfur cluster assembly protein [Nitrososphaera sp.]|jgi:metal-sulfur cluster biosynthetic enzyme
MSTQEQELQQIRRKIFDELTKIVDPEIGVSIMELELVDKVDINNDKVNVDLHLTSPFCPAVFGFKIAQDVRDNIYRLPKISEVKVNVSNHFMADAINKQVNESKYPTKTQ